jgi:hypothetical protein
MEVPVLVLVLDRVEIPDHTEILEALEMGVQVDHIEILTQNQIEMQEMHHQKEYICQEIIQPKKINYLDKQRLCLG